MSATWLVPELVTTDFNADFEDLLIPYIKTKYTITNPDQSDTEHFKIREDSLTSQYHMRL